MKTYPEIISVVRGDIERLESEIVKDLSFPNNALNELLLAPAKRIRPALAFLFMRALGIEPSDEDFAIQTAVELAHSASLIHDDIIDISENRRGMKTLNAQVDKPEILREFLETFSQMAQGEINQYFTRFEIPTLEEYLHKTVQKTAGLFKLALRNDFGLNFGIAFQIHNDLKDIDEDIKNGIYTAPVIFAGGTEITPAALEKTKDLINTYLDKAASELENLPRNEYSQALREILGLYGYKLF